MDIALYPTIFTDLTPLSTLLNSSNVFFNVPTGSVGSVIISAKRVPALSISVQDTVPEGSSAWYLLAISSSFFRPLIRLLACIFSTSKAALRVASVIIVPKLPFVVPLFAAILAWSTDAPTIPSGDFETIAVL